MKKLGCVAKEKRRRGRDKLLLPSLSAAASLSNPACASPAVCVDVCVRESKGDGFRWERQALESLLSPSPLPRDGHTPTPFPPGDTRRYHILSPKAFSVTKMVVLI